MAETWARFARLTDDQIPAHLTGEDARDLNWYFHVGGPGAFERSPLAGQLHRSELYSSGAVPCLECGGSQRSNRAGTGLVPEDPEAYRKIVESERRTWLASGLEPPDDYPPPVLDNVNTLGDRSLDRDGKPKHPGYLGRVCPRCAGQGWIPTQLPRLPRATPRKPTASDPDPEKTWNDRRITANPTGSSIRGATETALVYVDEVDAARIGVIGRRLGRVADVDVRCVYALDAYFGDDGGQLIHIYPLVPAGKKLLRRAKAPDNPDSPLSPAQLIENELWAQHRNPNPTRRRLLETSEEQAKKLFERSCRLWNRVVHGDELLARHLEEIESLLNRCSERKGAA